MSLKYLGEQCLESLFKHTTDNVTGYCAENLENETDCYLIILANNLCFVSDHQLDRVRTMIHSIILQLKLVMHPLNAASVTATTP